jgi:hypothetical protein
MLKALGILALTVALEVGFLFTVVAPSSADESAATVAAAERSAGPGPSNRTTVAFDAPARRW